MRVMSKIEELRRQRGLSQEVLAVNAGVAVRTVRRAEKNTHETTRENLKKIARALGVKLEELQP